MAVIVVLFGSTSKWTIPAEHHQTHNRTFGSCCRCFGVCIGVSPGWSHWRCVVTLFKNIHFSSQVRMSESCILASKRANKSEQIVIRFSFCAGVRACGISMPFLLTKPVLCKCSAIVLLLLSLLPIYVSMKLEFLLQPAVERHDQLLLVDRNEVDQQDPLDQKRIFVPILYCGITQHIFAFSLTNISMRLGCCWAFTKFVKQ